MVLQGFPEPGLSSGPSDTLPRVFRGGVDMEALPAILLVPLEPLLWTWKAELRLESFSGMVCPLSSSLFVFPFGGGHLKKLPSGFVGAAKPKSNCFLPFSEKGMLCLWRTWFTFSGQTGASLQIRTAAAPVREVKV